MSSVENRQNSPTPGQQPLVGPVQMPGFVSQHSSVEQLPFPDTTPQLAGTLLNDHFSPGVTRPLPNPTTSPGVTRPLPNPTTSPGVTGPLPNPITSPGVTHPLPFPIILPGVTRNLGEVQTDALPPLRSTTAALRQPVVIPSTGKKSKGITRPPKARRWVVHLAVTSLLVLIAVVSLMAVVPAGNNGEVGFNPFRPIVNWAQQESSDSPSLLAQQAATVTAVTQDGYESGKGGQTYPGLPTPPPGSNNYDGFTYGQCTYWADLRYHELTGIWVPWGGNAWEWVAGARAYGWNVSSSPHVPSIIVLEPGVQGAGYYGHVAVVESINPDGSVHTSNWNWYANGGGWATLSYWDFRPGPGVYFIWK